MVLSERKNSPAYRHLKLLGDAGYNMPTQFILKKNMKQDTAHQLLLKINSKLGGTNQVKWTVIQGAPKVPRQL
jgi:hypothetical protein